VINVLWLDELDIPKGLITGPFESVDQAKQAIEGLAPLFPDKRLSVTGGDATVKGHWR